MGNLLVKPGAEGRQGGDAAGERQLFRTRALRPARGEVTVWASRVTFVIRKIHLSRSLHSIVEVQVQHLALGVEFYVLHDLEHFVVGQALRTKSFLEHFLTDGAFAVNV